MSNAFDYYSREGKNSSHICVSLHRAKKNKKINKNQSPMVTMINFMIHPPFFSFLSNHINILFFFWRRKIESACI